MSKLTVVIPSTGRPRSISTHKWLEEGGVAYYIALHSEHERRTYLANPTIAPEKLVVTGAPYGMLYARQAVMDAFADDGDWVLMLDDDFVKCTILAEPWYSLGNVEPLDFPVRYESAWQRRFNTPCDAGTFLQRVVEDIARAETNGVYLCGWSPLTNYYFRAVKYRAVGYVEGEALAVRKSGLRYDMGVKSMDDMSFTAQNLLAFGRVQINHFIFPHGRHYQPGGMGSYEDRKAERLDDCAYLIEKYPGLLRYKAVKGQDPHSDLALRLHSPEAVAEWRRGMGVEG